MKYEVTIKETLTRTVEVEADSMEDAVNDVMDLYYSCEIVLNDNDDVSVDFIHD